MNCPTCPSSVLVMTERNGIEIDYCPTCRGVWLDRGELDKIIERVTASTVAPASVAAPSPANAMAPPAVDDARRWHDERYDDRHERRDDDDDDDDRRSYRGGYQKKKRRESLLGELFDF